MPSDIHYSIPMPSRDAIWIKLEVHEYENKTLGDCVNVNPQGNEHINLKFKEGEELWCLYPRADALELLTVVYYRQVRYRYSTCNEIDTYCQDIPGVWVDHHGISWFADLSHFSITAEAVDAHIVR